MKSVFTSSIHLVSLLVLSLILVACGGNNTENSSGNSSSNGSERNAPVAANQQVDSPNEASSSQADSTVNVVAEDFAFVLDANEAPAGMIIFALQNEGAMPHDFAITVNGQQHKTEMLMPGQSGSLTVELQPGTYEYICTVPGHDVLGMKGTFSVK